jgi:hypothetical protein
VAGTRRGVAVIGIDQEPTREILDELDRILGPVQYAIAYAEDAVGIRAYVRTRERPPREWAAYFAPGLAAESVLAVWHELTLRIDRIVNSEPPEPPPVTGEGGEGGEPDQGLPPVEPGIDNELPPERPPVGGIGGTLPTRPTIDNELPGEQPGLDNELPGRPPHGANLPTVPEIDNALPDREPVPDNELPGGVPPYGSTLPTRPGIDNTLPTLDEPPLRRTAEECDDDDDALEADDVSER